LDVCIRTGERERGQLQGGAYRPTKPLNRRGGGREKETHTHNARVYISSIERDPAGIIIYPQPPPKPRDFTRFLDPSNSAVERKKIFSISQSRWRRLSRYTKVWVGLILNSPFFSGRKNRGELYIKPHGIQSRRCSAVTYTPIYTHTHTHTHRGKSGKKKQTIKK
jgi:hypothetical protein